MQARVNDKVNQKLIQSLTCNKLSERSKGRLHYQIWQDQNDQSFGIAISKNESTGGFSSELIKVDDIFKILSTLSQQDKPFHAVVLKELFIGKSVNNSSFLAAILVDQKILKFHPQTIRLLEVCPDYELWQVTLDHDVGSIKDKDLIIESSSTTLVSKLSKKQNKSSEETDYADHQKQN